MNITRINNLVNKLKQENVEKVIISNPKTVQYFMDLLIEPGERMYVLLVSNDGSHTLFVNKLFESCLKNMNNTIIFEDTDDYISLLASFIINDGIIAVDSKWPACFLLPLQEKLSNCQFICSSNIVDGLRRVKDANEQKIIIEASIINDKVISEVINLLDKGFSEKQLVAKTKELFLLNGCSDVSFEPIISFGANTTNPHHDADDTIGKQGDCVVIDIGGIYHNYCSDMTRTIFLGEVTDRQKEIYNIVLQANLKAIEKAKAGNKMSDVDKAAREYIESKGFGKYFNHRTGHSIGMEVHEVGDVSKVNDSIIQVGQVFSIEPGIYIPNEKIGVRIEDLVLITEDGCKVLNNYSKDIFTIK